MTTTREPSPWTRLFIFDGEPVRLPMIPTPLDPFSHAAIELCRDYTDTYARVIANRVLEGGEVPETLLDKYRWLRQFADDWNAAYDAGFSSLRETRELAAAPEPDTGDPWAVVQTPAGPVELGPEDWGQSDDPQNIDCGRCGGSTRSAELLFHLSYGCTAQDAWIEAAINDRKARPDRFRQAKKDLGVTTLAEARRALADRAAAQQPR
ncbi:hypothetical protein [Arthrobacter sp. B1I2]|uniref:hypothetical protein n=1 Tax=Arthrobacter sp. B1I2 TaxID=3042263 RepID=UPI00277E39BC|nr:hypothetical protein [Arthrobacter sp. B1I2]MDQ0733471.1 hypothetical protein [Arthrobacter sp. B1I2]